MKNRWNFLPQKGKIVLLAAITLTAFTLHAEEDWHSHSLRIYRGEVFNGGKFDARSSYRELSIGSEDETGITYAMSLKPTLDLEFTLSEMKAAGTQYNEAGSGNEGNYLDVDLDVLRLFVTAKRRYLKEARIFVPWLGAGIHGGIVETDEQEFIAAAQGHVAKARLTKMSSTYGIHASGGADIYPFRASALAVMLEGRYNLSYVNSPFKGDINSAALFIGLKWDFGYRTF